MLYPFFLPSLPNAGLRCFMLYKCQIPFKFYKNLALSNNLEVFRLNTYCVKESISLYQVYNSLLFHFIERLLSLLHYKGRLPSFFHQLFSTHLACLFLFPSSNLEYSEAKMEITLPDESERDIHRQPCILKLLHLSEILHKGVTQAACFKQREQKEM